MGLISLQFAAFFIFTLLLYFLIPLKYRWIALLIGSIVFYLLVATPYTIFYFIFSIGTVYLSTMYMVNHTKQKKVVYIATLCVNIFLLIIFKYINGISVTGSALFSLFGVTLPTINIALIAPLGMSFYTLQLIGYLTDVYWGISEPQKNPAKFALFASYFPSLSSGPILRYNQVENELYEGHSISYTNITFGLQRILWGLFKKLVIAERMGAIATPIFNDSQTYGGIWVWIGLFTLVIYIYTDFSGNMDFIIGISECFGVRIPENFTQPFFSNTIQEFWQRWHITLGTWLKDYIMYPLLRSKLWGHMGKQTKKHFGKKAAKLIPTFFAMFILWIANGVWHGGSPKYIATVMWFCFAVIIGQLLEPVGNKMVNLFKINVDCFSWRLFCKLRTILVYSVGALFFAAPGVKSAILMIKNAITTHNYFSLFGDTTFFSELLLNLTGGEIGIHVLFFSLILLVIVETFQNRGFIIREWLANQNIIFRWIIIFSMMFSILIFGIYGPGYSASEFIYAGF